MLYSVKRACRICVERVTILAKICCVQGGVRPSRSLHTPSSRRDFFANSQGQCRFVQPVSNGIYFIAADADGYVRETYSRNGTLEDKFQRVDASTRLRGVDFRLRREAIRAIVEPYREKKRALVERPEP
jgi:hypothetical protein